MGNLGATEILLIFLVVLLLFGARRIPEIARGLGKGIREFKDATTDIKRELTVDDARRPGLPQGQTVAREPFSGDSTPAYAPAVPGMPGAAAAMTTGVGGLPAAVPAYEAGGHASGLHETATYETGDAAHGIPSTGTAHAPVPPMDANDQPRPRTGA